MFIVTQQSQLLSHLSPALLPGVGRNLCLNRHGIFLASLSWVSLLIHDIKSDGMTQQSWAKILVIVLVFCAFAGDALGWSGPEEILASKRERHAITREKYSGKSILDIQQEMSSPMDVAAKQSSDMFPQADNGQTARSTSKPAPRRKEYNIV